MRRFARTSPRSIAFASVTSSAAVSSLWRPTSARKSCRRVAGAARAGRPRRRPPRPCGGGLLLGDVSRDLEPDPLELARQLLDVEVGELVLQRERLELGGLDEAALLAPSR